MQEYENIHDKLMELLGSEHASFNILQKQIDVDLQLKYFDFSRRVKKELNRENVIEEAEMLFDANTDLNKKKEILAKLASIDEVEAFRVIEQFYTDAPDEIIEWTALAYQESRMMLESKILDENQILISTGLGGKGQKLRYLVVLLGREEKFLSDVQKKVIQTEFNIILEKHDAEVEDVNFSETMARVKAVIPMNKPVKAVFEEALLECNNYGNFLKDNFIITNVKELTFSEIKEFLRNNSEELNGE